MTEPRVGFGLGVVSVDELRRHDVEEKGLFDLSDPETPVALRACRSCQVAMRFPFEGGVRPALMGLIRNPICESCQDAEEAAEELASANAQVAERVRKCGIPPALYDRAGSWDELIVEAATPTETEHRRHAIDACRKWAELRRPERGLFLYGPSGSVKTHLAGVVVRHVLHRLPVRWVSVAVLVAQLQGAWDDGERQQALKVLTAKTPVVLDDFDKVNAASGHVKSLLFAALDVREQARAPAIVTSNLGLSALERLVGDPIVSRIAGRAAVLPYPGPDLRLKLS